MRKFEHMVAAALSIGAQVRVKAAMRPSIEGHLGMKGTLIQIDMLYGCPLYVVRFPAGYVLYLSMKEIEFI